MLSQYIKKYPKKLLTTRCVSPVVTHPSTRHAQGCLTSQIGRDTVFSTWYDRKLKVNVNTMI